MVSIRPNRTPAVKVASAVPQGSMLLRAFVDGEEQTQRLASVKDATAFAEQDRSNLVLMCFDRPTVGQIAELATAMELHPLVVEDLINANQRPKVERYDEVLFAVTRAAEYRDRTEEVVFSEFHILARGNVVALLCQRRETPDAWDPESFRVSRTVAALGAEGFVYTLLDYTVDGYVRAVRGLDTDKEQIERQVFTGDSTVTERIYRLSREVIDLQHAALPLDGVISDLYAGFGKYRVVDDLQNYLQDVSDHLSRVTTRITELRDALNQILGVNSTLVTQRQNEDMKRISGWAAILFAPTLIGAIYGMNFDVMPELHWTYGYPIAVGAMVLLGFGLWFAFKRKNWM